MWNTIKMGLIDTVLLGAAISIFVLAIQSFFWESAKNSQSAKEKTCITYPESKVTICAHNHEEYKVYE